MGMDLISLVHPGRARICGSYAYVRFNAGSGGVGASSPLPLLTHKHITIGYRIVPTKYVESPEWRLGHRIRSLKIPGYQSDHVDSKCL